MQSSNSAEVPDFQRFLSNPEALLAQPMAEQLAIANHPDTPRSLLEVLVNSDDPLLAEAARLHVNWGEAIEDWQVALEDIFQTRDLGQNDRLAVELLRIAPVPPSFLSQWVPAQSLMEGLKNPHLPSRYRLQLLERLAQEPTLEPRLQVAESPDTPQPVLERLVGDLSFAVRLATTFNPNCPAPLISLVEGHHTAAADGQTDAEELSLLGNSPWPWVRLAVARNPSTPEATFLQLIRDRRQEIPLAVAQNPAVSGMVLTALMHHPDQQIQTAIASHPHATEEILHHLFANHQTTIKRRERLPVSILRRFWEARSPQSPPGHDSELSRFLARQPETPVDLLAELAAVDVEEIRANLLAKDAASRLQNVVDQWISDALRWLTDIAKHPNVSMAILERLVQYPCDELKLAVAQHPNCPAPLQTQILRQLATGQNERIQCAIAWDENTPVEILEQLAGAVPSSYILYGVLTFADMAQSNDHRNQAVIAGLLGNCRTPEALRESLWQAVQQEPDHWGRHLKDESFRLAMACNASVAPEKRQEYLQQIFDAKGEEKTLEQLAKAIHTPPFMLVQLAQSESEIVRNYVAKNSGTPTQTLAELACDPDIQVRETALKNPNTPQTQAHQKFLLDQYAAQLAKLDQAAKTEANGILARRPNSPYALANVVKTGDRNAKMTAARSRQTPMAVLEQLAQDADEAVRSVVTSNPNLPLATRLAMTRDPSLQVRSALTRNQMNQTPPPEVLEQLADDESDTIRGLVAEHSATPVQVLVKLAGDSSIHVKRKVVSNPNTPETVLTRLGLEEDIYSQRNPNTPGVVLAHAVSSLKHPRTRSSKREGLAAFLKHPVKGSKMPAQTLAELVDHPDPSVRYRVAQHPNTPAQALKRLANDDYVPTLRSVAENPNTPEDCLERLVLTSDLSTRLAIVQRPNVPAGLLSQIVQSTQTVSNVPSRTKDTLKSAFPGDQYDLLIAIARKPETPLDALEILARREFIAPPPNPNSILPPRTADDVMRSLVYNPTLTPTLLNILTQDPCEAVRIALLRHPNLTPELWQRLAQDPAVEVRKAIAASSQAPASILSDLATDDDLILQQTLATNPHTPAEVLTQWAQHQDLGVRRAIAANPSTPVSVLEELAQDAKVEVRRAVATNDNAPSTLQQRIEEQAERPALKPASPTLQGLPRIYYRQTDNLSEVLTDYGQSSHAFVRFVTFLHPETPSDILAAAAQSTQWLERYAVADNPATSDQIRQALTQDSNQIVRACAASKLNLVDPE